MVKEITPAEFIAKRAAGHSMTLVDVRDAWEIEIAPVPTPTLHIPMAQVADQLAQLDSKDDVVVICRSGGRSMAVARFLEQAGFGTVSNVSGGILAWSRDIDPSIRQY